MTELDGRTSLRGWRLAALAAGLVLANAAPALGATYNTGASAPTSTTLWAYTEGNPPAPAPACHGVALSIKVPTGSLELTDMAFEIAPIQPGKVWFRLFVFDEMFLEWDEVWSGCDDTIGCQPQRTTPGVQGWEVASNASTNYGPIAPMTGLTWGPSGNLPDGHYGVVFCSDSAAGYDVVAADPFPSGGDELLRSSSSGGFLWARDDLHSVVPSPGPPLAPTVAFTSSTRTTTPTGTASPPAAPTATPWTAQTTTATTPAPRSTRAPRSPATAATTTATA